MGDRLLRGIPLIIVASPGETDLLRLQPKLLLEQVGESLFPVFTFHHGLKGGGGHPLDYVSLGHCLPLRLRCRAGVGRSLGSHILLLSLWLGLARSLGLSDRPWYIQNSHRVAR